jgi:hypothetical protein
VNFRLGLRGGTGMADYYSLIAKAVGALDLNTEKARRRLYERARTALRSRMHGAYPPFHRSEIAAAELSLEMAIEAVEAEAVVEQNAKSATLASCSLRASGSATPSQPANQNNGARRSPARLLLPAAGNHTERGDKADEREPAVDLPHAASIITNRTSRRGGRRRKAAGPTSSADDTNPLATRGCRGSISSLFLDIEIAADDFGHIGVFFLGFSNERGIVEALVIGLDLILCLGRPAWLLLALRFRVGIFQGDELVLPGFSHNRLDLAHRRAPSLGAQSRTHLHGLEDRAAFRADDWGLIEILKLRTAIGAQTLRSKLRFRHGFQILESAAEVAFPQLVFGEGSVNGPTRWLEALSTDPPAGWNTGNTRRARGRGSAAKMGGSL